MYWDVLRTVLDKHAPPAPRKVITHNSSPWFGSIRDELFIAKRKRRQADGKWRNTKLTIFKDIGLVVRMSILDTEVDGSNPSISMFFSLSKRLYRISSVDSAVKLVPGGDNLVKVVQCYELFEGIAHKNYAFSFSFVQTDNAQGLKTCAQS